MKKVSEAGAVVSAVIVEGAPGPNPPAPHLVKALRAIARDGGGRDYVAPKTVRAGDMRELRTAGCVNLIAGVNGQTEARLTVRGLQVLAAAPGLLQDDSRAPLGRLLPQGEKQR